MEGEPALVFRVQGKGIQSRRETFPAGTKKLPFHVAAFPIRSLPRGQRFWAANAIVFASSIPWLRLRREGDGPRERLLASWRKEIAMNRNGNRVADPRTAPRPVGRAPIAVAAMGWSWAVALLSTREHLTAVYTVLSAAPPLWGFFALSNASLAVVVLAGALLGVLAHAASKGSGQSVPSPTRWLLGAWVVPLADLVRCLGLRIPFTFFEPIVVAGITGAAVRGIVLATGTRQTDGPSMGIAS